MGIFSELNEHGQPQFDSYRSGAVADRQVDELIGIIKGVTADCRVHPGEVEFLVRWLEANRFALDTWPGKAIYPRLVAALADGVIDPDEEVQIQALLLTTVGGNSAPAYGLHSDSTALPFDRPAPPIEFQGRQFCFTGECAAGSRSWCQAQVESRGGINAGSITKKLDFLIIGEIGSRDWMHSTHGRKIEKAIEYRDQGAKLAIVSERHWFEHL